MPQVKMVDNTVNEKGVASEILHNTHDKIHKRHPFRRALPAIAFIIAWLFTLAAGTLPGWLKVSTTWVSSVNTTSSSSSLHPNSVSVWFICLPDTNSSNTQFFSTLKSLDLAVPNSEYYVSLPWIINITGQFPGCVFINYWRNQFLVMRIAMISSLFFGFWGVLKLMSKPYDYVSGIFYLSFHAIPLAIPTIIFTYRTFARRGLNFIINPMDQSYSSSSYYIMTYSYPFIFAYVALAADLFLVFPLILSNAAHHRRNRRQPNQFVQVTEQVAGPPSFVREDENPFKLYITPASTTVAAAASGNNHKQLRITRSSQIDIRVEESGNDFDELENRHAKDSSFARDAYAVAEAQQGLPAGTGLGMAADNTGGGGSRSSSRRGSINPDEKGNHNIHLQSQHNVLEHQRSSGIYLMQHADDDQITGNPNHVPLGKTRKHHSTQKLENRVVLRFIGQKSSSKISLDDRSGPSSPVNHLMSPKSPRNEDQRRRRSAQDVATNNATPKMATKPKRQSGL